jgi:hypothetical protein
MHKYAKQNLPIMSFWDILVTLQFVISWIGCTKYEYVSCKFTKIFILKMLYDFLRSCPYMCAMDYKFSIHMEKLMGECW